MSGVEIATIVLGGVALIVAVVTLIFVIMNYCLVAAKPALRVRFVKNGHTTDFLHIDKGQGQCRVELVAYNDGEKTAKYPSVQFLLRRNLREKYCISLEGSRFREIEENLGLEHGGSVPGYYLEWSGGPDVVVHSGYGTSIGTLTISVPCEDARDFAVTYRAQAEGMKRFEGKLPIKIAQ